MNPELVSVLIPAFNQEKYLAETLESIFLQTHRPLEIIIVNDGSTDATGTIAESFAKKHDSEDFSVQVITQKNSGVITTCETAFSHAHGSYILRLDGDDTIPTNYVAVLKRAMQGVGSNTGYAYCDAEYVGARTGRMASAPFSLGRLVTENYIHVSALVRRECIETFGYFSPTMAEGFEDWDFWLNLAEHGISGVYCADTVLYYRQHHEASRNALSAETHRKLRKQVQKNHPQLYGKVWVKSAVRYWQVQRRVRRYLGIAG